MSEKELVSAARRQEEHAVVALIERNGKSVAAGLRAAGLAPRDPLYEDAQNQALLAIWQQFPSYRGEAQIGTWMFAIAKRTALSRAIDPERRERRRRRRNLEHTVEVDLVDSVGEVAVLDRDLLAQVLDRLSADDREVLVLRAVMELKMSEIAEALYLSEAGAKARYRRARRRAAAIIRELEATGS